MFTRKPYMWEAGYSAEFDESQEGFIQAAMSENLNHARHIENERMSLLIGVSAMVAGVLAVGGSMLTQALSEGSAHNTVVFIMELVTVALIFGVIIGVLVLAKRLNSRWNKGFDRHMYYAKSCYYLLHQSNFEHNKTGDATALSAVPDDLTASRKGLTEAEADEISALVFKENFVIKAGGRKAELSTMPLYCFDINRNIDSRNRVFTKSTKNYFDIFYTVLMAILALMIAITLAVGLLYLLRS
ncbi:MAG: hypothetical protein MJ075_04200 [Oscillospiraceae bacterium]|nr:hypothetical protein [Oscillospiraceae bacterium]